MAVTHLKVRDSFLDYADALKALSVIQTGGNLSGVPGVYPRPFFGWGKGGYFLDERNGFGEKYRDEYDAGTIAYTVTSFGMPIAFCGKGGEWYMDMCFYSVPQPAIRTRSCVQFPCSRTRTCTTSGSPSEKRNRELRLLRLAHDGQ